MGEQTQKFAVYRDESKVDVFIETTLQGLAEAVWGIAQHHGSGCYVAVECPGAARAMPSGLGDTDPEQRVYLLKHEWLEEE